MATTSYGIESLDFLQSTIATFYMAVPSVLAGAEYLYKIVKLHPLLEILRADLILDGNTAHPANFSSVIALQAMQIRYGRGPGFV